MTTAQLEIAICNQYDNGRYSSLGADGGALKYISVVIDGNQYWCDITLDHDIAKIRRIWRISKRENNQEVNDIHNFNYKNTYYGLRV